MRTNNSAKLYILKNLDGVPIRRIQSTKTSLALVQNKVTKRIELLESDSDFSETHSLLQTIDWDGKKHSQELKNIGTLTLATDDSLVTLDPRRIKADEADFPLVMQWSSGVHGGVISFLMILALLIPVKKVIKKEKQEALVTIELEKSEPRPVAKEMTPPKPPAVQKTIPVKSKKVAHVVPRKNKNKPLLVKQTVKPVTRKMVATKAPKQFQRLGTLSALSSAIQGSRQGMGSGLRGSNGGTGGIGRGAGAGRGNGTMGRGRDSGGGYEQALYGRGLIAGQVGAGGGGFGSGWGEGSRGSGGYGTKGKGGGHSGYGTSKLAGSGSPRFSYPVREDAVVEGGLDREAVDLVIMKNLGQIIYCYELGLQQQSNLRGRVAVDFTINGSGRVSHCSVANSSLRSDKVENCMISKIKTWKFPQPVGGVNVDVNYPFALQRVSQN
ncbi:MAG: hypothetical protein RJB66_1416 [Pseudomonadota bacterium]|jgi:TonB family protein